MQTWLIAAAINGFLAVAAGAIGAHALKSRVTADALAMFETAVRYQMWHALALLGVAWLTAMAPERTALNIAGWAFVAGILLFCGALYAISIFGARPMAALAPLGGVAFLIGWGALVTLAWKLM